MSAGARERLVGVPNAPGRFLSRPRLLRLLEERAGSPLIVVRGPGGAGKSALVADWLRHRPPGDEIVVWMSLDAASGSRIGFWHRVFRLLHLAGVVGPEAGPGPGDDGDDSAERLLRHVVDDLAHAAPVRLVIDDFHHADPHVADDLAWVVERTDRMRAVLATRRRESVEDALVRARLDVGVLDGDVIAFTPDEAATVSGLVAPGDAPTATALYVATHGHPLAVRLAAAALETSVEAESAAVADSASIADAVAAQMSREFFPVFRDGESRECAIRLSIAPYIDVDLARQITGRADVADLIASFERDGIMTTREVGGVRRAAFHPLVGSALNSALGELPAEDVIAARLATADFLEAAGDPVAALAQLLAAEAFDLVWPLTTRAYSEFWSYFSSEFVACIQAVPLSAIRRHPTLVIALASVQLRLVPTPSTQTRALVDEALPRLQARLDGAAGVERFLLAAAVLGAHRVTSRFDDAAEAARVLLAMIEQLPAPEDGEFATIDVALVQIALTGVLSGHFAEALDAARRVSQTHLGRTLHAMSIRAFVVAYQGFSHEAVERCAEIVERATPFEWRGEVGMIGWHVAEALTQLDRMNTAAAFEALLEVDRADDYGGLWPYTEWTRNLARLLRGEQRSGAQAFLDLAAVGRRRIGGELALDLFTASGADLLLAAGQISEARRVLSARASGTPPLLLSRARLALADDDPARALALVGGARGDLRWTGRQRIEAGLLCAVARHRLGLDSEARADAELALAEARRSGASLGIALAPHADLLALGLDERDRGLIAACPDPFADALNVVALTPRERDVLAALSTEGGIESIAASMFVSVNTIKTQLRGLYRKLGVTSRDDAVAAARRRGLLEP